MCFQMYQVKPDWWSVHATSFCSGLFRAVSRGSGCYEFETSGYGQIVKEDISSSGRFWHIFRIHSVQLSVV